MLDNGKLYCSAYLFARQVQSKHIFLISIMVSAKDDDGSVDAAMKSLVRYLLDKSKFIQPKNSEEKKEKLKQKNKKKPRVDGYKKLSTIGIQEVYACKFL